MVLTNCSRADVVNRQDLLEQNPLDLDGSRTQHQERVAFSSGLRGLSSSRAACVIR